MKTSEILNNQNIDIIKKINDYLNDILDTEVDDLSVSQLSWVKMVASTSISTMKKAGKDNEYILTHWSNSNNPETQKKKEDKVKKFLSQLSPEKLKEMGITLL